MNELERERIKKEEENRRINALNDGRNGIDLLLNGNGEEEEEMEMVGPITRSGRRNSARRASTTTTKVGGH